MITWRVERTVAPTADVLTLTEVKDQLRIDGSTEDAYLERLIKAAIAHVEGPYGIGVILASQEWALHLDNWPGVIEIPLYPVQSVTSIEYLDEQGSSQTLDTSRYRVDLVSNPARITREFNETWPSVRLVTNAITVNFEAGYSTIPEDLKAAMLMIIAHWYEQRESVVIGTMASEVPQGAQAILNQYRVH